MDETVGQASKASVRLNGRQGVGILSGCGCGGFIR
jgi:hypothetical protein